jgi:hypothetical protein
VFTSYEAYDNLPSQGRKHLPSQEGDNLPQGFLPYGFLPRFLLYWQRSKTRIENTYARENWVTACIL